MDCSLSHAHTRTCTYAHTRNYIIYWRRRGAGEERSILKNRQIMFPSVLPSSPSAWCPNLLQLTRSATKQDTIAQSHPKSINTQGHNPPNSPDGGSHVQVCPEMFDWAWVSGSRTFTELSQRSPVLWKVHMRVFLAVISWGGASVWATKLRWGIFWTLLTSTYTISGAQSEWPSWYWVLGYIFFSFLGLTDSSGKSSGCSSLLPVHEGDVANLH